MSLDVKKKQIRFPLTETVLACNTSRDGRLIDTFFSVLDSVARIKPWPKATQQGVGLVHITAYSSSRRQAGGQENLEAGTEAEAMEGAMVVTGLPSCSLFVLKQPGTTFLRVAPPTEGWACPHQSAPLANQMEAVPQGASHFRKLGFSVRALSQELSSARVLLSSIFQTQPHQLL